MNGGKYMNKQNCRNKLYCLLACLLAACMLLSFAACGGSKAEVTDVTLDRASLTLNVGEEEQLTYTVLPAEAAGEKADWLSSAPAVATVSGGKVKGVAEGTALVRVTVGGVSATCTVTVVDPDHVSVAATGVLLNKATLSLTVGESEKLTATVQPENATDKTVSWSTSAAGVASVSADGTVTATGGGTAVITARTANNFSANCVVTVAGEETSEPLYVAKVSSLAGREDDFIMGMDISSVLSLEAAGVTYSDFDGAEKDVFAILKENGVTDIRVRVWNDPTDADGNSYGGGNCDIDNAVAIAERCEAAGLGIIVDFHYSDFWADPGKQALPKAWAGYTASQVADAIYAFTKESLTEIKATGVDITMVQIGNETNGKMCGASDWATICDYMDHGAQAVRDVTGAVAKGGAKVAVHFTNAGNNVFAGYASTLNSNDVDYDVFGVSWYPYYASHGTLANLTAQLQTVHDTYGKEVMVLETAYAYTEEDFDGLGNTALEARTRPITVQGQANAVRDVIEAVADLGDWGLGICYWEGAWIAASESTEGAVNREICKEYGCGWATAYAAGYDSSANDGGTMVDNQTFFRSDGTPLESLKIFKLVYEGQTVDIKADYLEEQEAYYTVGEGPIVLPDTVNVILNNGSQITVDAVWAVDESELAEYIDAVGLYEIEGTTMYGGTCVVQVWVMNVNLLEEGSFEGLDAYGDNTTNFVQSNTDLAPWTVSHSGGTSALQLFVSNNSGNARMGTNSFHFWDSGTVEFDLYQTLDAASLADYGSGAYGCSFDLQGGDGTNFSIYAYITVEYEDGTSDTFRGNAVTLDGWQVFNRTAVTGAAIDADNVLRVTVGIHVYAEAINQGPWGNIDNAQFYFEG